MWVPESLIPWQTTLDYHSKHWPDENETILEHFLLKDLSRLRFQLRFIVTIKQTDSIYWVVTRESRLLVYKHLCSITVVRKDSVLNAYRRNAQARISWSLTMKMTASHAILESDLVLTVFRTIVSSVEILPQQIMAKRTSEQWASYKCSDWKVLRCL